MSSPSDTPARPGTPPSRWLAGLWVLLLALVAMRLWMMATLPLTDSTEARYGDISRLIVEGGYWLMPHVDPQTPFFAKPAMSFWMSAISGTLLGVSEFTLRLPHLLLSLATMAMVWAATPRLPTLARTFGMLVFLGAPLSFISAGAVMTDATQMTFVALAMLAAWKVLFEGAGRGWLLVFYAAVGLGALTKGLATIALIGLPLAMYALLGGGVVRTVRALFSVGGVLLFLVIVVPYYAAAEHAYPGFLKYFIIGEHFKRFLDPAWAGDRYGSAHEEPIGSIWLYWAVSVLPWLAIFLVQAWRSLRPAAWRAQPAELRYWWSWVLAPLLFFTFTRNLIWTYALTAVPPFAVIAAHWLAGRSAVQRTRWLAACTLVLLGLYGAAAVYGPPAMEQRSARGLVRAADRAGRTPDQPIIIRDVYSFSSDYYTRSHAVRESTFEGMAAWLSKPGTWMIVPNGEVAALQQRDPRVQVLRREDRASLLHVPAP